MCGIAGFWDLDAKERAVRQRTGLAMAAAIAHRGPDSDGFWDAPAADAASASAPVLVHRRLSILDLSPEGAQPMASPSGRYVIVFNGEIYNFQDLRGDLEALGVRFRGRSDTEVLLAAVEAWGLNRTLQKIAGMFAFALWDRQARHLHFARDRLGKKPLYIGRMTVSGIVFGSELKALCAHPSFAPDLSREGVRLYTRYGYVPAPHTIYQDTLTLPPGCRMMIEEADLPARADVPLTAKIEPYWSLPRVIEDARLRDMPRSEDEALSGFSDLLGRAVSERMVSDVPLGAFLSGGIDSSLVTAMMQARSARPVKTYTIGFHEAGFDEAAYARDVAAHLGTEHHELYLSPEAAREVIPALPSMYDEPFADISAIPTYLVSKFAREDVTVALSGDGGDELMGGYNRHLTGRAIWRAVRKVPAPLRGSVAALIRMLPPHVWDRLNPRHPQFGERLYKLASVLPMGSQDEIYRRLLSVCADPAGLLTQGYGSGSEPPTPLFSALAQLSGPGFSGLGFAERMMAGDALHYLPNDVLVKVDRASMAASLEARAPLLDHRLFEYVWGLPGEMKLHTDPAGGEVQGKWLLRRLLAQHVPAALFERPKQGFSIPVAEWLRGPLRDWMGDLLADETLRRDGIFNPVAVAGIRDAHLRGEGRHAATLWMLLMFQAWRQRSGTNCKSN